MTASLWAVTPATTVARIFHARTSLGSHTNPIYMQINKIHVELPVAGNKFLSALQQARHPRRRRRRRPESALPKRGENLGKPSTTYSLWGFLFTLLLFRSLFAYFLTFSPVRRRNYAL